MTCSLSTEVDWETRILVPALVTIMFRLLPKKVETVISPLLMAGRTRCCSDLTLPVVCFITQNQYFKAKLLAVVHLPCFPQAAVVLTLYPVKSLVIPPSG